MRPIRPWLVLSALMHQKQGVTCIKCHGTNVPVAKAPVSACLGCHANSKDGRYVGTGAKKYAFDGQTTKEFNPHVSHLVDLPCRMPQDACCQCDVLQ